MGNDNSTAKVICILDYIYILWILGLFVEKDNEDVKFHTNQGLILFILNVVAGVLGLVLGWIPLVGGVIKFICWAVNVLGFALMIVGIVNAAQGQRKPLPVIGNLLHVIK